LERVIYSVVVALNLSSEPSSTGRFVNGAGKNDGLQSGALRNISLTQETRVSLMHEIIASLDRYFCSPRHNFNWKRSGVTIISRSIVRFDL
jgi:hypothetical protein